jgi:hypothetical protein
MISSSGSYEVSGLRLRRRRRTMIEGGERERETDLQDDLVWAR